MTMPSAPLVLPAVEGTMLCNGSLYPRDSLLLQPSGTNETIWKQEMTNRSQTKIKKSISAVATEGTFNFNQYKSWNQVQRATFPKIFGAAFQWQPWADPQCVEHKARCLVSSQQWHLPSRLFFVVRTENDAQIVSRSKLKVFGLEHFFESSTPYNFDFVAIHTFHHFSYPIRTSQGSCVLRISGIPCLFVGVTPRSRRCGHVQTPFTIELYTLYSWTFHLNTFFFAF